jgi:hypothetical protein
VRVAPTHRMEIVEKLEKVEKQNEYHWSLTLLGIALVIMFA